ncbi:MAG: hypothetical protein ACOYI4_10015 [Christensenellales bacterium]|jgi:hypothetical protein
MADYKAMYYHLAGRMATTVEVLEYATGTLASITEALVGTSEALTALAEKLKLAQQATEEMFINSADEDLDDKPEETE